MPTNRRRRRPEFRPALTAGLAHVLAVGDLPDPSEVAEPEIAWWWALNDPRRWWDAHGAELLDEWIEQCPGSRPWSWWRCEADEPRQVLCGAELLRPAVRPGDWQWHWKDNFGIPAFTLGPGAFVVESEASYLLRLGLLGPEEKATLTDAALDPEVVIDTEALAVRA
jgi:hypothetical protein